MNGESREHPIRFLASVGVLPHKQQRYETVGDYFQDENGELIVRVSDMGNDDFHFLVAIHELVEAWLCKRRGIPEPAITAFDEEFERNRPIGDLSEPGDAPGAPYGNEHCLATAVERMCCAALDINWADYEKAVQAL